MCALAAPGAAFGKDGGQRERIRRICEAMQERLGRIRNIQCTQLHRRMRQGEIVSGARRIRLAGDANPRLTGNEGGGSGTLVQFLRDPGNRIGVPVTSE